MADGIFVAAAGAMGQLRTLEIVANNLAHSVTPGFKQDEISFQEVLTKPDSPMDVADKRYSQVAETKVRKEQGELIPTGNPLDLALTGNAFLRVRTEDGERLTRNGRLTLGADGVLRSSSGHAVVDPRGELVRLPSDRQIRVQADGAVIDDQGQTITRLGVQGVDRGTPLRKAGDGLFMPAPPASLDPEAQVMQGFIEGSNANPVKSMVALVETQRTFAALHQVIRTYQDVDRRAVELSRQG